MNPNEHDDSVPETSAPAPEAASPRRWRIWLLVALAATIAALLLWWWWPFAGPRPGIGLTFAPKQEGEFLIIVAPFRREGGDPQAIGGTLANGLRQTMPEADLYRVEAMPRAPNPSDIPDIVSTYEPQIVVTGWYDGTQVLATVYLVPPPYLPPPPASAPGIAALAPFLDPVTYHVFGSQGISQPLVYLEPWIIGQSYFWQGRYAEALPFLQQAKRQLPRQVPIEARSDMDLFASGLNWELGYISGPVLGNWQAARDLFEQALAQAPSHPAPALGLAAAMAQLDDLEAASELLRRTLRQHPNAWQIYYALAEIAAQQRDTNNALSNYEQAIVLLVASTDPNDQLALADLYFQRGYFYLDNGDAAGALADFQQALALGRNDIYVQGNLGWAAYELGEMETAVTATAAARQLAPDRPDLAFNEGLHLLAAGQVRAANVAYDEAINLTLQLDDVIVRSTYFGMAYNDLEELALRYPEISAEARAIQERIDIANG